MKNTLSFDNHLDLYDFELPDRLLAKEALMQRDESKLLLIKCNWKEKTNTTNPPFTISHHLIKDLSDILHSSDTLITNNTRVSHRRVRLQRKTGADIEALFLEPQGNNPSSWACIVRGKKKLKDNEILLLKNNTKQTTFEYSTIQSQHQVGGANGILRATKNGHSANAWDSIESAEIFFQSCGEIPIPPYFKRRPTHSDTTRYQTVFAKKTGSVAAPTAGLHFTPKLMEALQTKGIHMDSIQLEIGYGTFAPLIEENWKKGKLHKESYELSSPLTTHLNQNHGRIIAVGTTTLRALESNLRLSKASKFTSGSFQTDIFLKPPDQPKSIDGLLTNFHLPRSSLLMLVASLLGTQNTMEIYKKAIQKNYRFFSYGDAMLILP